MSEGKQMEVMENFIYVIFLPVPVVCLLSGCKSPGKGIYDGSIFFRGFV